MTLTSDIQTAKDLTNWIGEQVDGVEGKSDLRHQFGGALLHLGLVHHASIVRLIDEKHYASAFALLRPLIETFVRHHWVMHLASETVVLGFSQGNDPDLSSLAIIDKLEADGILTEGNISSLVKPVWGTVCDFTHSGGRIISCHLNGSSIEPSFTEREVSNVLKIACGWVILIACSLADWSGNKKLGKTMLERSRQFHMG